MEVEEVGLEMVVEVVVVAEGCQGVKNDFSTEVLQMYKYKI